MSTLASLLKPEQVEMLTRVGQEIENLNKIIADHERTIAVQKDELDGLRRELWAEQAKNRAAREALMQPSSPELPTVNLPTMRLEEFTPKANGSGTHRNPLADSFVLE